jgi:beta-glucanase (GH16 family)
VGIQEQLPVSATGNVMHHDEGGYDGADYTRSAHWIRGDYNYYRDTFDVPLTHMKAQQTNSGDYAIAYDPSLLAISSSSALGNNLYYQHRQSLEFKAGQRVKADGLIFQGGFANTASSIAIAFTSVEGMGITDVSVTNSTFKHQPGGMVFSSTEGGSLQTPPMSRILIKNNLFWDLRAGYFAPGGPINPGNGWVFEQIGHEDFTMDHNTVFNNLGRANATFWVFDAKTEGVKITNNILFQGGGAAGGGIYQEFDPVNSGPNSCAGAVGPMGIVNCAWPGAVLQNNLLLSDQNSTQMNATGWYGSTGNFIPSDPTSFSAVKWQSITGLTSSAAPTANPNFTLRNDSPYISGGTSKGTDGKDLGADMVALERAQGKVYLTGASSVTSNAATITFVAPDAVACPIDYSTTDPTLTSNLTRLTQAGVLGPNSVTLTGLSASTVYYYRVDCAVEQPTGQFRTAAPGVVLPTVSITAPSSGATLSGTAVSVSATATAGSGVVSSVQFRLDGANLGAVVTTAPYSTSINSVTLTNGAHSFSAVVTNSLGQQASSPTVSTTVRNVPSVTITAPTANAALTGTAATLTATASAPTGRTVSSVQFIVDGVNVGALDTASPYTQTFDTTVWSNATHSITAVVADSAGVTTTSSSVSVTISNTVAGGGGGTGGGTGGSGTFTTPAVAVAAGFNNLTFDDEFETLSLAANGNQTGFKWYPGVYFACSAPSSNMTVTNGILDLKWTYGQASCYDTPVDTTIMTHNQTSTMTAANGQTFRYGYFETRMKFDIGPYMWPAFWLNGEYGQSSGGRFMELDIFEYVNAGGYGLYGTLHDWLKTNGSTQDQVHDGNNLLSVPQGTDFTQYHTYGCLWTSTTIKWYFDGQLVRTATPPASANTGPELYLMLSQQVGQNWSTGAPSGTPAYNNYIDYVRVWQQ